ncbi:MAG: queuosine precursor transporter [Eubacteriales bacterium]|nr:queuosine precursor transporter [Eubacteriales bacterium]
MNECLFFASLIFFLLAVVVLYRLFGCAGLYAYIGFATILANIQVCKSIELFGLSTTAGAVLYASTFLCTDILSEKYGKKTAASAVWLGIGVNILWLAGTQITLLFNASASDYIQPSLAVVFGMVPRITFASLLAYVISQRVDVFLYHRIWQMTGNKNTGLWIRNNGSTMISQLFDTVIFASVAFLGTMPMNVFWQVLLTTYFFKVIIAACDTPFIYLARNIQPKVQENVLPTEAA